MINFKIIKKKEADFIDMKQIQSILKHSNEEKEYVTNITKIAISLAEEQLKKMLTHTVIQIEHLNSTVIFPYAPCIKVCQVKKGKNILNQSEYPSANTYQYLTDMSGICGITTSFNPKKDEKLCIEYEAGYVDAQSIPKSIQNSVINLISIMYDSPEKIYNQTNVVSNMFSEYVSHSII